jgi:hypothetical protein
MKAMKTTITWIFLICAISVVAQRDKDWNSKNYPLKKFRELNIEGGYQVTLIQGDEYSLLVKADDDNAFDYLDIRNNEESLSLKISRKNINLDRINLYITFRDLESIKIQGGVTLDMKGFLDFNNLRMHVSGGAKMDMKMKAENLVIIGEGGFLFHLEGVAKNLDVKISGAGHVDANEFKAQSVSFKVEGVGTGSVYATESLYASIQGVGKIKYKGNPKISRHIDGLGSISSE